MGSYQTIVSYIHQNQFFTFYDLLIFLIGGLIIKLNIHQNQFSHLSICWYFSFILIYHNSYCLTIFYHEKGHWSLLKTISIKNIHSNTQETWLSSSVYHTSYARNYTRIPISYRLNIKQVTTNQKNHNISNTDDIQSCVTPQKQNYSVHATYTLTDFMPLNATLTISSVQLYTPIELPSDGK